MTPTINWKYSNFCAYSTYGDKSDVVYRYSWECTASIEGTVFGYRTGTITLNLQNPTFVYSYNELTEEVVASLTRQLIPVNNIVSEAINEAFIKTSHAIGPRPAPWEVETQSTV